MAAASAAPLEQRWLLPVAVGVVIVALYRLDVRLGALVGLVFGLAFVLPLVAWMRVIGVDAWLLTGTLVACYYAILGGGIALLTRLAGWPVWVATWWVSVETAMSSWPLGGFPWTRLAWSSIDTPFARWLPWVGVAGVSFLLALGGSVLAHLCLSRGRGPALIHAVAAAVAVGVPVVAPAPSLSTGWDDGLASVNVAAVQGDVPGAGNDVVAVHRQVTTNHVNASVDLAEGIADGEIGAVDFVVWPENSTAVDPFQDTATNNGIDRAVAALGVPVLVGAIVDGSRPDEVLNQGLVWSPDGTVGERYTKHHPVPFGEYVPFRSQLAGLKIGRLDMVPRDMVAGTRTEPLAIAGARVADLICFDVAYDDSLTGQVRNGAQLVTIQTSNASFTGTAQQEQQFAISRLRAMETGRTVVVASTNGISGVIGPDGGVLQRLEPRTTDVAIANVPLVDQQTPATRYGPLVRRSLGLVGIGALLVAAVGAWRRRPASEATA